MSQLLSVAEARLRLLNAFAPIESEQVPLAHASGRVLAEEVVSKVDLPLFNNSSMDGFAVRAGDLDGTGLHHPIELSVIADIPAGKMPSFRLEYREAARIMTGAPLPEGADAVVPVEDTDQYRSEKPIKSSFSDRVRVYRQVNAGDYVRLKGQDVRSGDVVLQAHRWLRPQDVGLLAMLGDMQVSVFRRPRVGMLSTGDELLPVERPLQPGKIHDSNAYTLANQVTRDGGEAIYLGIAPDNEESVTKVLEQAIASRVDLIISSAGVSVGAFDFVRTVVEKHGEIDFWRVNMRPGKPLAFGHYRHVPFIGLPGNPVSAFVGYEVFVRPALLLLGGLKGTSRFQIRVKILEEIESDGRESYLRAVIKHQEGDWIARLTGHQGSGNLLSLVQANALLIIPSGVKSLPSGAIVDAWLLDQFGSSG
jgi:molybdopterin molybdotransferase